MTEPIERRCECCGRTFACGGYACWCGSVPMTERQSAWIAARYDDCLCPLCLAQISAAALDENRPKTSSGA